MTPTVTKNDVGFAVMRVTEATGVITTLVPDHPGAVERDRLATAALRLVGMGELDCCREQLAELQMELIDARERMVAYSGKQPSKTGLLVERATEQALAIIDEHVRQQATLAARPGIDDGGDQ